MAIPEEVLKIAQRTRGVVLVTGPAGGGKSTTLACVVDAVNNSRTAHIITIEDPIEFLYRNNKSIISYHVVFSDDSRETMEDKILRMIRNSTEYIYICLLFICSNNSLSMIRG